MQNENISFILKRNNLYLNIVTVISHKEPTNYMSNVSEWEVGNISFYKIQYKTDSFNLLQWCSIPPATETFTVHSFLSCNSVLYFLQAASEWVSFLNPLQGGNLAHASSWFNPFFIPEVNRTSSDYFHILLPLPLFSLLHSRTSNKKPESWSLSLMRWSRP